MPGEYDSITKIQYNTILPNFNTESRPSEIFIFSPAAVRPRRGDLWSPADSHRAPVCGAIKGSLPTRRRPSPAVGALHEAPADLHATPPSRPRRGDLWSPAVLTPVFRRRGASRSARPSRARRGDLWSPAAPCSGPNRVKHWADPYRFRYGSAHDSFLSLPPPPAIR